jgi:hypothetical protein
LTCLLSCLREIVCGRTSQTFCCGRCGVQLLLTSEALIDGLLLQCWQAACSCCGMNNMNKQLCLVTPFRCRQGTLNLPHRPMGYRKNRTKVSACFP